MWVYDVCADDVDEWEDDELGFRCTDVGIGIGILLGVAVGVRNDEAVIEVEDFLLFANSVLSSASILHIPLIKASRSREPVRAGSDWSLADGNRSNQTKKRKRNTNQIALNLSLSNLDFDHITRTIGPGSTSPLPSSDPGIAGPSDAVTKSIDKPLHPLRSRPETAIADVGERSAGFVFEEEPFKARRL